MKSIQIGEFKIKNGSTPFTIAEAGINHNGDLEKALEMVQVAKKCGVNAIKFQTFQTDEFVSDINQMYTYKSQGREITESMHEMFKRYELTKSDWIYIKEECIRKDILFFSTPQNYSDLELLLEIGVDIIKVGSDDFTNLPLLRQYSQTSLPIILSCGMANLSDVYNALSAVGFFDGYPTILLLCTSQYPTPPEDVNLNKLSTLRSAFPNLNVGFSDHTVGSLAASIAVAFGACIFEKHFTLDHDLYGPDHNFSANPDELLNWTESIEKAYRMIGCDNIKPTAEELKNKKEFQRSIVAIKDIKKGEKFTTSNIGMKRVPGGYGLPPMFFDYILDKEAKVEYKQNQPIIL